jgi:hypothetical protein
LRSNKGLPEEIAYLLPASYNYIVQQYNKNTPESFLGAEAYIFSLKAWANANDESTAMKWINDFQKSSKSTYCVTKEGNIRPKSNIDNSSSLSSSVKEAYQSKRVKRKRVQSKRD